MTKRKISFLKAASALTGCAVAVAAVAIMAGGYGLQEGLDFGAGSYYYADIPDFDKYLDWNAFNASLPYWVYVVLFLVWGALMFALWKKIDRSPYSGLSSQESEENS